MELREFTIGLKKWRALIFGCQQTKTVAVQEILGMRDQHLQSTSLFLVLFTVCRFCLCVCVFLSINLVYCSAKTNM